MVQRKSICDTNLRFLHSENSVDFSTPSVKRISDFFMYLYQDLNNRPSTIDGYRTSIIDTLGLSGQHIAHNGDLAWVTNKVSNQGHWEKVPLFPSSDFIAKNQLARENSQSVSPVTIPALTTIVDRQFKKTGPCVRCGP